MTIFHHMANFYRDQYGDETDQLFTALIKPQHKIALINPFLKSNDVRDIVRDARVETIVGHSFYWLNKDCVPRLIDGLMSHYFLDLSSVLPALLLPLHPSMRVLDMCSAPGGKLLVMISRMIEGITWIANDISKARSMRLKRVLAEFLPREFQAAHMMTTNKDGNFFGLRQPLSYDAILLDAPCSSEGHVVNDEHLLKKFTGPQKGLPMRQYSLLAASLLALKPGGYLMYATCTINKHENDGVIKRLLQRKSDLCSLVPLSSPLGDKSEFGTTILPHRHGAGPSFFSLLRRQ